MRLIRIILISIFLLFVWTNSLFANENESTDTQEKTLQITINNFILDAYKKQGNKILSELDANLEKITQTKEAKIEAYSSIQETLTQRKKSIENDKNIGKNSKTILIKYLDYIIKEIDAKKREI